MAPEREAAACRLVQALIDEGYSLPLADYAAILKSGPTGMAPDPVDLEVHRWYQELSPDDQEQIQILLKQVASRVVLCILRYLDGMRGSDTMGDEFCDFAVFLQSYSDADSAWRGEFSQSIRVNPLNVDGDLLFTIGQYMLGELQGHMGASFCGGERLHPGEEAGQERLSC